MSMTAADGTQYVLRRDTHARTFRWRAYRPGDLACPVFVASTRAELLLLIMHRHG